jgi:SAM-dependent methyltransferase
MDRGELEAFLRKHIRDDYANIYGVDDHAEVESVTRRWFDETVDYSGRWTVIEDKRRGAPGRVLDMAAGCGTFVLNGLRRTHDIWGVEPEEWKREFFRQKLALGEYPAEHRDRIVDGIGESLPFPSATFDVVTTFQTLEHVRDVAQCIREMLRVLKPGGALYIRAPDYGGTFEGHYRLPFPPGATKKLAARYLQLLGRPTHGLEDLNFITRKSIVRDLADSGVSIAIRDTNGTAAERRRRLLEERLPKALQNELVVRAALLGLGVRGWIYRARTIGRAEKNIDLWVDRH